VIAVWDEATHRFTSSASFGLEQDTLNRLRPLLDEAAPDLAGSRESYNLLSELWPNLELPSSSEGIKQNPIIALPLKIDEKSIGLIYVLRPLAANAFSQIDQPILAAFAEQAAIAVQNTNLVHLLAEEKQRIEAILDNSADGIMSVDSRCRILGFNLAMEKMTGYSREEVLGQECFRVLNFTDQDRHNLCNVNCPMLMNANGNNSVLEQEGLIRSRDGKAIDVAMAYSLVRSADGKPINAVVNVRDISKFREMENFRETILSMLGHELQTPLAIIKGYTSTLTRSDAKWDMETFQQGLQVIEEESDRLSQVMNKLILASRLSAGVLKLNKEPIQLVSLVNKIIHRLSNIAHLHRFAVDFEADFPEVIVEPQLMEQVLTNLIDNAIKYSPKGGQVTVSGKKVENQVRVSVADEGVGIPVEDMEHLFERFHRVEKGHPQKIQGTGLGLYICKSIIEAHGGKLEALSRSGHGSEFIFTLPLEA
jgi:PAS domain S-box-containing protein